MDNIGKIRILDQFDNRADKQQGGSIEDNQSGLSSVGSRKQTIKPVQLFNNNGPLQALNSIDLQQSELSRKQFLT